MAPVSHSIKKPSGGKRSTKLTQRPLKPLNGFIGFRKYYAPIFMGLPGFQQKDASGFLTLMWSHEVSQSTWTILAKAWSLVRDFQGKENSPLDIFIDINALLLDIVAPCDYLMVSGFAVVFNTEGLPALVHVAESSHPQVEISVRSVEGILENSINAGYVDANIMAKFDHNVLIMAPAVDSRNVADMDQASGEKIDHNAEAFDTRIDGLTIWNFEASLDQEYAPQMDDSQMGVYINNGDFDDFDSNPTEQPVFSASDDAVIDPADNDIFDFSEIVMPSSPMQSFVSAEPSSAVMKLPAEAGFFHLSSFETVEQLGSPSTEPTPFDFWAGNDIGYPRV